MKWNDDQALAWLAGLLEGEGCFSSQRIDGGLPTLSVILLMTDRDILERAIEIAPCATGVREHRDSRPESKQAYQISWNGQCAIDLMWAILPYMGRRRSDKILTNLADWLELRSRTCSECDTEFHTERGQRRCMDCRQKKQVYA